MRDVPFCKMNARQAEQDSRDQKGEKQNMKLYDLRTEYRENPRGLSVECPRFSWKIKIREQEYHAEVLPSDRDL